MDITINNLLSLDGMKVWVQLSLLSGMENCMAEEEPTMGILPMEPW